MMSAVSAVPMSMLSAPICDEEKPSRAAPTGKAARGE